MAYTVLARKYRSQRFDEVVGQDPIAKTLKNAIATRKVAHAYLFAGTRGVGKTTMARVLAKSLNCLSVEEPTTEPCCACDSCVAINIGEDIDVVEIDGATNNGVEQVRELRQNAIYRPARSRFKIYIIDEVHMLTVPAFNALLKILEEPPGHVKFIFATTEPNKVIPTIQSRCQRFDFSHISPRIIAGQLKFILQQEKIKYEEDLLLTLAKMANGSMRDGLSLLDRLISTGIEPLSASLLEEFLGQPNSEKIWNLIGQIGNKDAAGTLTAIEDLISTGQSEAQIVNSLIDYMRDLMVVKSTGPESELLSLTTEQRKRASQLAEKFDTAALVYNITALERLRWAVKNSDSPRALLDAALLRFALSEHFMNVDVLLSQLQGGQAVPVKKKELTTETRYSILDARQESHEGRGRTDDRGQRMEGRGQRTEDGGQRTEDGGQRTEDGGQRTEGRGQRTEGRGQRTEDGGQRTEDRGQRAEERRETRDEGRGTKDENQASRIEQRVKTGSQRKNEIINDPAVKTVLIGLDATITGIEEN